MLSPHCIIDFHTDSGTKKNKQKTKYNEQCTVKPDQESKAQSLVNNQLVIRPKPGFLEGGLHGCLIWISIQDLGDLGACSPRKFLEIRYSEVASEAILEQKQSRSSYTARRVLHPIFGCPCMHLLTQLTSNFHERRH